MTVVARFAALLAVALLCTACGATVREVHYFASYDANGKPTEFFRLTVEGRADFSGAKFQSGYYDERALDLFFNEIGGDGKTDGKNVLQCPAEGSCDLTLSSLNPKEHGAYTLILSTDADAVANAIGAFAGNEAVAEAVSNLVNRDAIRQARQATFTANRLSDKGQRAATAFETLRTQAAAAQDASTAETSYVRALTVLSNYLGGDTAFSSMQQARAWFDAERAISARESRP